jgi:hypothetical protein
MSPCFGALTGHPDLNAELPRNTKKYQDIHSITLGGLMTWALDRREISGQILSSSRLHILTSRLPMCTPSSVASIAVVLVVDLLESLGTYCVILELYRDTCFPPA